jgi:HEAT repeat protein
MNRLRSALSWRIAPSTIQILLMAFACLLLQAETLAQISPGEQDTLPALMNDLKNPDARIRSHATYALQQHAADANTVVPALELALRDPDSEVRQGAARALLGFGSRAGVATTALIDALNDSDSNVRQVVIAALGAIGPQASRAAPNLIAALKDPNSDVRDVAALQLGSIKPDERLAIPALVEAFHNSEVRNYASGQTGAAWGLSRLGVGAVPALIVALKDSSPDIRRQAAFALSAMRLPGGAGVSALAAHLKDPDPAVRTYISSSLGFMGPDAAKAVPALATALSDKVVMVRINSAQSLERIGPKAGLAVSALSLALKDSDSVVGQHAALALGKIGPDALPAIPLLIKVLKGSDIALRNASATALLAMVDTCRDIRRTDTIQQLKPIIPALREVGFTTAATSVQTALTVLQAIRPPWYDTVRKDTIERHGVVGTTVFYLLLLSIYCSVLVLFCVALLFKAPFILWRLNERVERLPRVKLPSSFGGVEISVSNLLVFGFFHYHRRVLDAWLARHMTAFQDNFSSNTTVKERDIFVEAPVEVDHHVTSGLKPEDLKDTFQRKRACILIWGEGGAGKTSLACEIARWVMSDDDVLRPCLHRMLTVIIEQNLTIDVEKGKDILTEFIRGQLKEMLGEEDAPSADLVVQLLQKQRILLLVDGLSELNDATRNKPQPLNPAFSSNAFIATSRQEAEFSGVTKTTLHPIRIQRDRLSSFLGKYLDQRGKRELFNDSEFFEACRKFSVMVGNRDTTVLLLKLYAERLIILKQMPGERLPENIPDLMLDYLNEVNRKESQIDCHTLQVTAKIIAWECLRQTFRPVTAKLDAVLAALGGGEVAGTRVKHLEQDLKLIQTIGSGRDQVKFLLDPLAEYLAALNRIEQNRNAAEQWKQFLTDAEAVPEATLAIRGFLLAVLDCCLVKGKEYCVPESVAIELTKRTTVTMMPQAADSQTRPLVPIAASADF